MPNNSSPFLQHCFLLNRTPCKVNVLQHSLDTSSVSTSNDKKDPSSCQCSWDGSFFGGDSALCRTLVHFLRFSFWTGGKYVSATQMPPRRCLQKRAKEGDSCPRQIHCTGLTGLKICILHTVASLLLLRNAGLKNCFFVAKREDAHLRDFKKSLTPRPYKFPTFPSTKESFSSIYSLSWQDSPFAKQSKQFFFFVT